MFFLKTNPIALQGTFNSNLFIVIAVDASSAPTQDLILKPAGEPTIACQEGQTFFYKEVRTDKTYSATKNAHVLRDARAELSILKRASTDDNVCAYVVKLIAEIDLGMCGVGLVLEMAHCNFQQMYMKVSNGIAQVLATSVFGGRDNYLVFLRTVADFFIKVATYLQDQSLVYCDWKFENILCFHTNILTTTPVLKLSDFGSALTANTPIANPNNVNQLYSSPTFSRANTEIIPSFVDDHISICYLFYKLNHQRLPWELDYNVPVPATNDTVEFIMALTSFMKSHPLFRIKTTGDNIMMWPDHKIFHIFDNNKIVETTRRKKRWV